MGDELQINSLTWSSALASLPFVQLERIVSDVKAKVWWLSAGEREGKPEHKAFWEVFDLLHSAIEKKWQFKEYNAEGIPDAKIETLAHDLNMEYLKWHPDRWPQYENDPRYRKDIAKLKLEKSKRKRRS